jgi:hypothetical protein
MSDAREKDLSETTYNGKTYRITFGGEQLGYYLYVFVGNRCTHDYLQDTAREAKEFARDEFGVPLSSWTDAQTSP